MACVERIIAEDRTAYGINTGFGLLASTRIAREDLEALQSSLVLSHAAGVGEPLDDAMVRLIMVLKINSLARGYSGIRRKVIDALIALVNAEVYPHIPLKGSVGASGDLAPLAHVPAVAGREPRAPSRRVAAARQALEIAGLQPFTLAAKEGLALLNGTQVSTAYALRGLFEAEDLMSAALVCGGLSVEAMLGSRAPSIRASTRRAPTRPDRRGRRLPRSADRRQRSRPFARRLRQGPGPYRCAANRRSWAPA